MTGHTHARVTLWATLFLLVTPTAATPAAGGPPWRFTRVRATHPEMMRVIAEGAERSPTFLALVEEIQRSTAIVLVRVGRCPGDRFRSCVSGVEGDARQRHIRIFVDTRTTEDGLIATVAHELQHAVEIIRDPEAIDARRTLALFRRIGTEQCRLRLSEFCETEAARLVEKAVLNELDRAGQSKTRE